MYTIVRRVGNKGKVVGRAKTLAGAYRAKQRCEKKDYRHSCVVLNSAGYVHPFAGYTKRRRRS